MPTRVYIADVLVGEGEGCKGVWLLHGDALIAVDVRKAAISEKDEATKRATIRLPPPGVLLARVDHRRTKSFEVKTTTWIPGSSDQDCLRDAVMREAQELVASRGEVGKHKGRPEGRTGGAVADELRGPAGSGGHGQPLPRNKRAAPLLETPCDTLVPLP